MKNSILNLGKALNKSEQKEINGGTKDLIILPCILPELAPPPVGCTWTSTGSCTYKLVCNDIVAAEI